jgi:hypothetical protein
MQINIENLDFVTSTKPNQFDNIEWVNELKTMYDLCSEYYKENYGGDDFVSAIVHYPTSNMFFYAQDKGYSKLLTHFIISGIDLFWEPEKKGWYQPSDKKEIETSNQCTINQIDFVCNYEGKDISVSGKHFNNSGSINFIHGEIHKNCLIVSIDLNHIKDCECRISNSYVLIYDVDNNNLIYSLNFPEIMVRGIDNKIFIKRIFEYKDENEENNQHFGIMKQYIDRKDYEHKEVDFIIYDGIFFTGSLSYTRYLCMGLLLLNKHDKEINDVNM